MRFKRTLLAAFAGINLSVFAGVANADTIEHVISFGAQVPMSCTLSENVSKTGAFTNDTNLAASTFTVDIDGTTANETTGRLTLGTVNCTSSNIDVTMTRVGWIEHKTDSSASAITYTAKVVDDGVPINSSVISSANTINPRIVTVHKSSSLIGIDIKTDPISNLTSGDYEGTLTININPS